jgi:RecJ-like exonuclease
MATPVFSEREISNIRSTRKLCGNCHGRGSTVEQIPTRFARQNYTNGFATYLVRCTFCNGAGTVQPVSDGKMAASGGGR